MSIIAEQLAEQIEGFLRRRKIYLDLSRDQLATQILQYMTVRRKAHPMEILGPKRRVSKPDGWNDHAEQVWQDWFSNEVQLSDWLREVFRPVFGLNTAGCGWDGSCDGWREELLLFLPSWAQRSFGIVGAYDASQYESDDDSEVNDPRSAKVDPYLADHGSRRTTNRS